MFQALRGRHGLRLTPPLPRAVSASVPPVVRNEACQPVSPAKRQLPCLGRLLRGLADPQAPCCSTDLLSFSHLPTRPPSP